MAPDFNNTARSAEVAAALSVFAVNLTLAGRMRGRTCTIQRQPPEFRRFPLPGKPRSFGDFDRSKP